MAHIDLDIKNIIELNRDFILYMTRVADEPREFFKDKQLKMNLLGSRLLALEKKTKRFKNGRVVFDQAILPH